MRMENVHTINFYLETDGSAQSFRHMQMDGRFAFALAHILILEKERNYDCAQKHMHTLIYIIIIIIEQYP